MSAVKSREDPSKRFWRPINWPTVCKSGSRIMAAGLESALVASYIVKPKGKTFFRLPEFRSTTRYV